MAGAWLGNGGTVHDLPIALAHTDRYQSTNKTPRNSGENQIAIRRNTVASQRVSSTYRQGQADTLC